MVGSVSKAPVSQLVVPRIFMEQAGEDRSRHIGADAVVGEACAIAFSVGTPSLSPLFWIILCLCDSREDAVEGISPQSKTPAVANLNFWPVVSGGSSLAFSTVP